MVSIVVGKHFYSMMKKCYYLRVLKLDLVIWFAIMFMSKEKTFRVDERVN